MQLSRRRTACCERVRHTPFFALRLAGGAGSGGSGNEGGSSSAMRRILQRIKVGRGAEVQTGGAVGVKQGGGKGQEGRQTGAIRAQRRAQRRGMARIFTPGIAAAAPLSQAQSFRVGMAPDACSK